MESCRRPTIKTNSNHVGECNAKERKKHLVLKKIWYAIANQKVSPILLQRIAYIPAENTSSLVKKAQRYVVLLMMCYRVSSHNSKQNFDFSPGINILEIARKNILHSNPSQKLRLVVISNLELEDIQPCPG